MHVKTAPGRAAVDLTPWDGDPLRSVDAIRKQISFDVMVLGVFHGRNPRPDEIIASTGVAPETLRQWCEQGLEGNELFRTARRRGVAVSGDGASEAGLPGFQYAMAHVMPESLAEPRSWWLILASRAHEFGQVEQQIGGLVLRQCQVAFSQLREPMIGRLLVGTDHRLIYADPWFEVELLRQPGILSHLIETMTTVAKQRWSAVPPNVMHDFAVALDGRPYWVRFERSRISDDPQTEHWHLELYHLEEGELPVVGSVDDDRIARAIGFIHNNYQHSPGLSEIAAAVHVSPFHFHRLFKRGVGLSPKHYLQRKQLQVAKWLLRATREPVGSIATKTGFSSHGHFTSTFHRVVGLSPSQYREQH